MLTDVAQLKRFYLIVPHFGAVIRLVNTTLGAVQNRVSGRRQTQGRDVTPFKVVITNYLYLDQWISNRSQGST